MEAALSIGQLLDQLQQRKGFTDQQLAEYTGVSRWTIYRIRKGEIGDRISTNLVKVLLREQHQPAAEQVA